MAAVDAFVLIGKYEAGEILLCRVKGRKSLVAALLGCLLSRSDGESGLKHERSPTLLSTLEVSSVTTLCSNYINN